MGKENSNPSEFIMDDKGEAFIQLDDINNNLRNLSKNINNSNELMTSQNKLLSLILNELLDQRDEGKSIYNNGTLSTTTFTVIDTQLSPGHLVKGYTVRNTGLTNMFVAHNISMQPQVDIDVIDTLKTNPIFTTITPNEIESISYNVKCIKSVHLLAVTGTPTYKMKMVW